METIKLPECSLCLMPFLVNGFLTKSVKIPLLLHCAHPACETCIISNLRNKNFITCLICKNVSSVLTSADDSDVLSQFPIDHNLCGLYFNKSNSIAIESDSQIGFIKPVLKKRDTSKKTHCNECQNERAEVSCQQCSVPYCLPCFKKVHSAARSLRDHSSSQLNELPLASNHFDITTCKDHDGHSLEFHCEQCDLTICSYCLLASHNGHTVNVLQEKNKEYRSEVIDRLVKVSNIHRRLNASKKEVKQLLTTNKKRSSLPVESKINDHFLKLHGYITLLQSRLLNQIKNAQNNSALCEIMTEINTHVEETEEIIEISKRLLQAKLMSHINYKNLITYLSSVEDIPCYLIKDSKTDGFSFTTDDGIFKKVDEHCKLQITESNPYKLVNEKDKPDNYLVEKISLISADDLEMSIVSASGENEESCSSLHKTIETSESYEKGGSDTSSVSGGSSGNSNTKFPNILYPDELVPGCTVQVHISHLNSPSDFYVHRAGALKKLAELQNHLQQFLFYKKIRQLPPKQFIKGGIYLTLADFDKTWHRVRIIEDISDIHVHVHYIDQGFKELLHKEKLRNLPMNVKNTPPLAIRCKLADCEPINGETWDTQSNAVISQITNNFTEPVKITIINKTRLYYEVDMIRFADSYSFNVGDTLAFLNLAAATKLFKDCPESSALPLHHMKSMPVRNSVKQGTILEVKMAHIFDPSHFYVVIQQGYIARKKLSELHDDLQRSYSSYRGDHSMFNPQPGMYVAARYSGDKKWYRAEVVSIPNVKFVKVFYIDVGNTEVLNWKSVKILFSKFFKLPPQAQRCCLSDVEPAATDDDNKQWGKKANDLFQKETSGASLRAIVDAIKDDSVSLVLYKNSPTADICVNALLVRAKYAVSTGFSSTVVDFPRVHEIPKDTDTFQCDVSLEKKSKPRPIVTTKINKLTEKDNSIYLIKGLNGCLKIQINIKRIVDPGEFYVTLCYVHEEIKKLEQDLQEFYFDSKPAENLNQWKVKDRCVALLCNKWYRAIVEELIADSHVKVFIPDEGIYQIIENANLRPIDKKFLTQRDGVTKCHLGGLLPSLENWSKTSITEFEEFVKTNVGNLYISKMTQSEMKGNSLAVELFNRSVTPAGPLEAARDNWTSFNHYLRMIGLAKADSVTKWDVDGNIIGETQESDNKMETEVKLLQDILSSSFKPAEKIEETSLIDIHDIAVKWLSPEPVSVLEFIGTPTYVDDNANIYIQDFMKSTLTLPKISEDLTSKFANSLPTPYDLNWTPGDICAAQYFVDEKWYRGLVKKLLSDGKTLVQFVDYGNIDPCSSGTLRKKPTMTHIPIQATSFKLHTIAPVHEDGKWKREELDEIHSSVATKNCRVELEIIAGGYGVKRLIMADGQDAIALWVNNKWARYSNEPLSHYLNRMREQQNQEMEKYLKDQVVKEEEGEEEEDEEVEDEEEEEEFDGEIEREEENYSENTEKTADEIDENSSDCVKNSENDEEIAAPKNVSSILHWLFFISEFDKESVCKYEILQIKDDVEPLLVEVTAVLSETEIVFNIQQTENVELLAAIKEFSDISRVMQKEAPLQPLLEKPYRFKMCCAQFTADNSWYRAFVLEEVTEDSVLIQYVDYANVEVLPAHKLHKIADEWVKPKAQSILCCLHGVQASKVLPKKEIMERVSSCLSQNILNARIKNHNSSITSVELFFGDKLAYQPLIDEGIFIKVDN